MALSETLVAVADVWNQDNLDATGRPNYLYQTSLPVVVSAENIATVFTIPLAFTPLELYYRFTDFEGMPKPSCTSKAEIFGNDIKVTINYGGSDAVATDILFFMAKGNSLL